jgi:hypothetical protein
MIVALEGTIETPFGKISKKTALIGGAGLAGIIGIVWYRSKSAPDTSTSEDATGQSTADIDPATGFPYGSPEDVAALQADQNYAGGFGPIYYGGGGGGGDGGQPGPGSFTTNAQWSQYAEDYLVNTIGLSASDVGNALGKYLTGQALTDAMISIVNQAIAFAGNPPLAGENGYPPAFKHEASGPSPGGNAKNPVSGLEAHARYTQVDLSWHPSANATSYRVRIRTPNNKLVKELHSKGTGITVHDLQRNTSYEANVLAEPAASGATVAKRSFKTKK